MKRLVLAHESGYLPVAYRFLLFAVMWWALTGGTAESWWIGAPAVMLSATVSLSLLPPPGVVWREVIGFVLFFLWYSLKGGVDVAARAFHPHMPIAPALIEYPMELPPGLPQVLLANTTSLLPGTLSAEIDGRVLQVHVLDRHGDFFAELKALEERVRRIWVSASDKTSPGGE